MNDQAKTTINQINESLRGLATEVNKADIDMTYINEKVDNIIRCAKRVKTELLPINHIHDAKVLDEILIACLNNDFKKTVIVNNRHGKAGNNKTFDYEVSVVNDDRNNYYDMIILCEGDMCDCIHANQVTKIEVFKNPNDHECDSKMIIHIDQQRVNCSQHERILSSSIIQYK